MHNFGSTKIKIVACFVLIVLLLSAFFVTRFPPTPNIWYVSVIAICLFFLPVLIGTIAWLGLRKGLLLIAVLGVYALGFESLAVITGVPYGLFDYSDVLGPKILGITPYVVFLAWTPLVLGLIGRVHYRSMVKTIAATTILLVAVDMVLDPAAVGLGFWQWEQPGAYYGVPVINFIGWVVSGGIAMATIEFVRRKYSWPSPPRLLVISLIATILFWGIVNAFLGHIVPTLLAVLLVGLLLHLGFKKTATLKTHET